jgi:hypothetical protein
MDRTLAKLVRRIPALRRHQEGRWGYVLAWLLGVPIPILLLVYFCAAALGPIVIRIDIAKSRNPSTERIRHGTPRFIKRRG